MSTDMKLWGVSAARWMEVKQWFEAQTGQQVERAFLEDFVIQYAGEFQAMRYFPSDADVIAWMGTDATKWAHHFLELHDSRLAPAEPGWWEELLTGWFANALGAGESSTHKIMPLSEILKEIVTERTLNEAERQEGIAYRWLREHLPWYSRWTLAYPHVLKLATQLHIIKLPPFIHYRA